MLFSQICSLLHIELQEPFHSTVSFFQMLSGSAKIEEVPSITENYASSDKYAIQLRAFLCIYCLQFFLCTQGHLAHMQATSNTFIQSIAALQQSPG